MAIVGIDLGTTNSLVAVLHDELSVIIPAPHPLVPSVVNISPDGVLLVGEAARAQAIADPVHTITGIKRFIGRRYSEVSDLADFVAYNVVPGDDDDYACVRVGGRVWRPEEISAEVLKLLKQAAERYLGEEVSRAVITIPAYFNYEQANATRRAAELAGLRCERLVSEPTAAALAYARKVGPRDCNVLVVDLGGGTYDVSLVQLGDGVAEVKAIDGDGYLGGDDFDAVLLDWALEEINIRWREDVSRDTMSRQRVHDAVVRAKCDLSANTLTSIDVPYLFEGVAGWQSVRLDVTRSLFESLADELFVRLAEPIRRILSVDGMEPISEVLLVGGATRMPRVAAIVEAITHRRPLRAINPDEAVASGASIQGSILDGVTKDTLLLDVTPHTISVEVHGNGVAWVIEERTTIPTRKEETFTAASAEQTSIEVNVLQGGAPRATSNRLIGTIVMEGLRPPIGNVTVTVDIDANHVLTVTARDAASGRTETLSSYF